MACNGADLWTVKKLGIDHVMRLHSWALDSGLYPSTMNIAGPFEVHILGLYAPPITAVK